MKTTDRLISSRCFELCNRKHSCVKSAVFKSRRAISDRLLIFFLCLLGWDLPCTCQSNRHFDFLTQSPLLYFKSLTVFRLIYFECETRVQCKLFNGENSSHTRHAGWTNGVKVLRHLTIKHTQKKTSRRERRRHSRHEDLCRKTTAFYDTDGPDKDAGIWDKRLKTVSRPW